MRALLTVTSVVAVYCATGCGGKDSVTVTSTEGAIGDLGVLVDGSTSQGSLIDDTYSGSSNALKLGQYQSGLGEIIAYSKGHPPAIQPAVQWTNNDDTVTMAFDAQYVLPVTHWIVQGPYNITEQKVSDAVTATAQIWHEERQGVLFGTIKVNDATSATNAAFYTAFTCSKVDNLRIDIGYEEGAINVYWVNTVDFGSGPLTSNAVWCGSNTNTIAMGQYTTDHLFAHEVGHAFGLNHTNTIPEYFDTTNIMHNASNYRFWLTEGQTVRAVLNPQSAINRLAGRNAITRYCPHTTDTQDPECPTLEKRIWADGSKWSAN